MLARNFFVFFGQNFNKTTICTYFYFDGFGAGAYIFMSFNFFFLSWLLFLKHYLLF